MEEQPYVPSHPVGRNGPQDQAIAILPSLTAQLVRRPERREIPVVCDEQLVVEHYSR